MVQLQERKALGPQCRFSASSHNAAHREYKRDPSKTFEKASNGSPLHMLTLLTNGEVMNKSRDVDKINNLVISMHSFLTIHGPSEDDTAETYEICMLFHEILRLLRHLTSVAGPWTGAPKKAFESTLPIVIRLLRILCEQTSKDLKHGHRSTPFKPAEVTDSCVGLFLSHLKSFQYDPIADDVFEVVFKAWLLGFPSAVTIIAIGTACYDHDPEKMRSTLDQSASPKHIARLAVSRLRNQKPNKFEESLHHVNAIRAFTDHPRITRHMVEMGAIGVLCDLLVDAITLLPKNDLATRACLSVVNKLLHVSNHGFQEAIAHDLLVTLVSIDNKLKGLPTTEDREDTLELVMESLDNKIIHRLVCRSNLAAMLTAAENLNCKFPIRTGNPVDDCWVFFENRLFAMAVAYRLFIFQRTRMTFKCANPECKRVLFRRNSSRCAGCKEVLYCSRLCQKKDWKIFGHKFECRYEKRCAKILGQTIRDRAFLIFLASEDVVRNRFELRTMAERRFPHIPLHEIGYEVHFKGKHVFLNVYSIFDPSEEHNYSCAEHLQARRRAHEVEPTRSSLRIKVGQGDKLRTFYSKLVVDEIDKNPAIQATFDQLTPDIRQRLPALDQNRVTFISVPGIVEWIMARVKNAVGRRGVWNLSMIDREISRERTTELLAP